MKDDDISIGIKKKPNLEAWFGFQIKYLTTLG